MRDTFLKFCFPPVIATLAALSPVTNYSASPVVSSKENVEWIDTVWKATTIAKLNDPAPGGGNFEEFGDHYYLESGAFIFWARFGRNKAKDWALYSYNNGNTISVFRAFEKTSEPDGVLKTFQYFNAYFNPNGASKYLFYTTVSTKPLGWNYIYGWDGRQLIKIIGEGDRITLPGNREVVVDATRLEAILDNQEALFFFKSDKPDKISGWLLHDGKTLKPLFVNGDMLPGLPGVKIKTLASDLSYNKKVYISGDTILANLLVDDAPFSQAIFRITGNKTELIESSGKWNPAVMLHVRGSDHFLFRTKESFIHKNGNRVSLTEIKKQLPNNNQYAEHDITGFEFAGTGQESFLFTVAGNWPRILLYDDNKISVMVEGLKSSPSDMFKGIPFKLRTIPGVQGVFFNNTTIKKGEEWSRSKYFDISTNEVRLIDAPELKTNGTDRFDLSDIIAVKNENRLIVMCTPFLGVTGFYEFTK